MHATIDRPQRDATWWSAAIQFAGTLFFNLSTGDVLRSDLSTLQEDRLVWAPDVFGSVCFLASGVLAYRVSTRPRTMAAINLAGCVFFMISAVAAYVVPDTGSILDLAAANWNTALGALCFFDRRPDARPPQPRCDRMTIHRDRRRRLAQHLEALAKAYGNRFLLEAAPDNQLPEHGMTATDAMRLIEEELVLDGIPMRNLATFVTTWMEPEARR